jgi:hypothetical protein
MVGCISLMFWHMVETQIDDGMIHGEVLLGYVFTWLRHIIDDILWYMIGDIDTHLGDMVHELMMIW